MQGTDFVKGKKYYRQLSIEQNKTTMDKYVF